MFTKEVQYYLVQCLLTEPTIYTRAANIIKPEYFHSDLAKVVSYIQTYSEEYSSLPTSEAILAKTGVKISKLSEFGINHENAALDEIEQFCKQRGLEIAVLECANRLEKGNHDLERIIKEATLISLQRDLGLDYFYDPLSRLERLQSDQGIVPSGWKSFDRLSPLQYSTLTMFSAPSGVGKSVILQNLSVNMVLQGLNVIYITLELSEDLVGKRFDALFTDIAHKDIFKKANDVAVKVRSIGMREETGSVHIKFMPANVTTPKDIKAYIREWEIQTNKVCNILAIDYADLMSCDDPSVKITDIHFKERLVYESLRNFAMEQTKLGKPLLVLTASQITKTNLDNESFTSGSISGSAGKTNSVDLSVSGYTNPTMKEEGLFKMQFLKCRNSGSTGKELIMKYNIDTLRLEDHPDYLKNETKSYVDKVIESHSSEGSVVEVKESSVVPDIKSILARKKV